MDNLGNLVQVAVKKAVGPRRLEGRATVVVSPSYRKYDALLLSTDSLRAARALLGFVSPGQPMSVFLARGRVDWCTRQYCWTVDGSLETEIRTRWALSLRDQGIDLDFQLPVKYTIKPELDVTYTLPVGKPDWGPVTWHTS